MAGPSDNTKNDDKALGLNSSPGDTLQDELYTTGSFSGNPEAFPQYPLHEAVKIQLPSLAIPILPNYQPDWDHKLDGRTVEVGKEGLQLKVICGELLPARSLMVGVQGKEGEFRYRQVTVVHDRPSGSHFKKFSGIYVDSGHELFKEGVLAPVPDPKTRELSYGLSPAVVEAWCKIGVLTPLSQDWVQVCPKCGGLPTYRPGCPNCGSSRILRDQMLHHFACAHVGFVRDFERDGTLVCPKCRTRNLVVGADYDIYGGACRCEECGWTGAQLEQVGLCLKCQTRFPASAAELKEFKQYRVNRLDPLALQPES